MPSILRWLEVRCRWSKLRDLGQSNLVRASVLMPVFGYLLLLNEHVHEYLQIQFDTNTLFYHLPPLWRIWMLFYGTFLLAMGSLLYSWRCPPEIKQYVSAFLLVDSERHHLTAFNQTSQIADRLSEKYNSMSRWEDAVFPFAKLKPHLPNLGAGTAPELMTGDQWGHGLLHIWMVSDIKHPLVRVCVYLLFRIGIVILIIPAAFTFVQVSVLLIKRF
jgi:hypothetical protein